MAVNDLHQRRTAQPWRLSEGPVFSPHNQGVSVRVSPSPASVLLINGVRMPTPQGQWQDYMRQQVGRAWHRALLCPPSLLSLPSSERSSLILLSPVARKTLKRNVSVRNSTGMGAESLNFLPWLTHDLLCDLGLPSLGLSLFIHKQADVVPDEGSENYSLWTKSGLFL